MSTISVTVNGRTYKNDVEPRTLLVHYLRDQLKLRFPLPVVKVQQPQQNR